MKNKVLLIALLVFVAYWLVQAPTSFAGFVQGAGGWLWQTARSLFESVIDVVDSIGR